MALVTPKEALELAQVLHRCGDATFEAVATAVAARFPASEHFRALCYLATLLEDTARLPLQQRLAAAYAIHYLGGVEGAATSNPLTPILAKVACDGARPLCERSFLCQLLSNATETVAHDTPSQYVTSYSSFMDLLPSPDLARPQLESWAGAAGHGPEQQGAALPSADVIDRGMFNPPFIRPKPPVLQPMPGESIWLSPVRVPRLFKEASCHGGGAQHLPNGKTPPAGGAAAGAALAAVAAAAAPPTAAAAADATAAAGAGAAAALAAAAAAASLPAVAAAADATAAAGTGAAAVLAAAAAAAAPPSTAEAAAADVLGAATEGAGGAFKGGGGGPGDGEDAEAVGAALRARVAEAVARPLLPGQQQDLVLHLERLDAEIMMMMTSAAAASGGGAAGGGGGGGEGWALDLGLSPHDLPSLIEKNPAVAVEVLLRVLEGPQAFEFYEALAGCPLTLQSVEVVGRLAAAAQLPPDFLEAYMSSCLSACGGETDASSQVRLVRMVCLFVQGLLRSAGTAGGALAAVLPGGLPHELSAFCVQHSRIREAAALFRLLKVLEGGEQLPPQLPPPPQGQQQMGAPS